MINALIVEEKDNVIVAIEPIAKGSEVNYKLKDGTVKTLTAQQDITIYHKLAAVDIAKGTPIVKYGEHIGVAAVDIKAGEHVHEHNVESVREEL